MTKILADKYLEKMNGQELYHAIPNFTILAASLNWIAKEYFEPHYNNPLPTLYSGFAKGTESFTRLSATQAKMIAKQVLENYYKNPETLNKLIQKHKYHSDLVEELYSKITFSYVLKQNTDTLIKDLKDMVYNECNTNALGWYSLLFDENMCFEAIKTHDPKITPERFYQIWEKASIPVSDSFEKRNLLYILSLLKENLNWKEIAEKCQYMYAGFHGVANIDEVEKNLREEYEKYQKSSELIQETENKSEEEKQKLIKNFKELKSTLNKEEEKLVDYMQHVMEKRDRLRDDISKCITIIYRIGNKFFKEAQIPEKYLQYCLYDELRKGPQYLAEHKGEIMKREEGFGFFSDSEGNVEIEYGNYEENKNKLEQVFLEQQDLVIDENATEIKGQIGSKGNARGKVKIIINLATESDKMQEGDILVTGMTRPEFVPLMKKAAAIITDEGGITSHAAIISREMNIPCIIGTKIATKILKDNYEVEVNANEGIVKILEKSK